LTIKNATIEDAGNYKISAENVVGKAEADFDIIVKGKKTYLIGRELFCCFNCKAWRLLNGFPIQKPCNLW
jgi:hypothetical protein